MSLFNVYRYYIQREIKVKKEDYDDIGEPTTFKFEHIRDCNIKFALESYPCESYLNQFIDVIEVLNPIQ